MLPRRVEISISQLKALLRGGETRGDHHGGIGWSIGREEGGMGGSFSYSQEHGEYPLANRDGPKGKARWYPEGY